jgi:hypothetical protein
VSTSRTFLPITLLSRRSQAGTTGRLRSAQDVGHTNEGYCLNVGVNVPSLILVGWFQVTLIGQFLGDRLGIYLEWQQILWAQYVGMASSEAYQVHTIAPKLRMNLILMKMRFTKED